jgi:hypothetical protein
MGITCSLCTLFLDFDDYEFNKAKRLQKKTMHSRASKQYLSYYNGLWKKFNAQYVVSQR